MDRMFGMHQVLEIFPNIQQIWFWDVESRAYPCGYLQCSFSLKLHAELLEWLCESYMNLGAFFFGWLTCQARAREISSDILAEARVSKSMNAAGRARFDVLSFEEEKILSRRRGKDSKKYPPRTGTPRTSPWYTKDQIRRQIRRWIQTPHFY